MTIQEAIQKLTDSKTAYMKICAVKSVDKSANTCECEPVDNTGTLFDVRLIAEIEENKGSVVYPESGSFVIVGMISDAVGVVMSFSDISEIITKVAESIQVETKDVNVEANEVNVKATQIVLANSLITEPGVLGNKTTALLNNLIGQLLAFVTAVNIYATTQKAVAEATAVFAPLLPGYVALIAACTTLTTTISALIPQINLILSKTVKID